MIQKLEERTDSIEAQRLAYAGSLAVMIAHNINNPLNNIRMSASAALGDLKEGLFQQEELKPLLESIIAQTERLGIMVGKFRSISHGDSTTLSPVEINPTIENFYQLLFNGQYQLDHIELLKELQNPSPIAYSNEFALQEMIAILLSNARDALKGKSVKKVKITTWQKEQRVGFTIEDSGDGIPADREATLFSPFFTTKKDGMGLGLHSCYKIVKDLQGEIAYQRSLQLGGATFIITLPLTEK